MWISLLLILFALLCFYLRKKYSFWKERGVPGPNPIWFVGNCGAVLLGKKSLHEVYCEIYRKYEDYPFVGFYQMLTPVLLIREPELLKNIMVKDFRSFSSNDFDIDKNVDKLFGRNLFVIKGSEWKSRRTQLTTLLTSRKMKTMFPIFEQVSERMVKYIREQCIKGRSALEVKDLCVRFTLDIIAASVLGLEGNCFSEDCSTFKKFGEDFLSSGTSSAFKSYIVLVAPFVASLLGFRFIPKSAEHQFIQMVRDILENRRKNNIIRNDFLESITQLCKSSEYNEEIDIIAQASAFLVDGYETGSTVLSFILYKLAGHPISQSKLRDEIERYCEQSGGKLDYDTVHEMPYLQACIDEAMRMMPALRDLLKLATKEYIYTSTNPEFRNLKIKIEPETSIIVPIEMLQNDAKYFDSPEEYIPERFFNKADYNKMCFLPFGEGHRSCPGIRFGTATLKFGVAHVIRHFEVTVNDRTKTPLQFDKWYFVSSPVGGLWLDFKEVKRE